MDYLEGDGAGFSVYYECATQENSGDFCGMIWILIVMICYCLLGIGTERKKKFLIGNME